MPTIAKFLGVARNSASKIGGVDYFSLGKMTESQSFDPDAKAYIQRVEGASGDNQILEIGVHYAINDFVVGCKDDGNWNAIKASCIMAGARTLAGALQPLVGTAPTNNNFVSGDYDRKTGLVGNGSTKYLNSNRSNTADPETNQHMGVYITEQSSAESIAIGVRVVAGGQGDTLIWLQSSVPEPFRHRLFAFNNGEGGTRNTQNKTGYIGMSRSTGTSYVSRMSGSNESITGGTSNYSGGNIYVFARRTNTDTANSWTNARLSFYSIGESLDLAKLDARVSTLMTSIAATI